MKTNAVFAALLVVAVAGCPSSQEGEQPSSSAEEAPRPEGAEPEPDPEPEERSPDSSTAVAETDNSNREEPTEAPAVAETPEPEGDENASAEASSAESTEAPAASVSAPSTRNEELAGPQLVETGGLALKRLVFARAVEERAPVDPGVSFSIAATPRVYAFIEVENPDRTESELAISWAPAEGGDERGRVTVTVGAARSWRTWAYTSTLRPGRWVAVVRNASDEIIGRAPVEMTP